MVLFSRSTSFLVKTIYPDLFSDIDTAAEVKDFEPAVALEGRDWRHMSRYAQLAMASAQEAMADSALDLEQLRAYRASEVHGNAYRRPGRYGLLTECAIEPPFVRPDYRPS